MSFITLVMEFGNHCFDEFTLLISVAVKGPKIDKLGNFAGIQEEEYVVSIYCALN